MRGISERQVLVQGIEAASGGCVLILYSYLWKGGGSATHTDSTKESRFGGLGNTRRLGGTMNLPSSLQQASRVQFSPKTY